MHASRWIAGLALAGGLSGVHAAFAVVTVLRSTGFVDSATAATSIHCTNLGPGASDIEVRLYSPAGALVCDMTYSGAAANATVTLSTRLTGAFVDNTICSTAPAVAGGSVEILVDDGSAERIRCAVRLLAASGAQPAFADLLPIFNRNWIPLDLLIFESGFEAGTTVDWSSASP